MSPTIGDPLINAVQLARAVVVILPALISRLVCQQPSLVVV